MCSLASIYAAARITYPFYSFHSVVAQFGAFHCHGLRMGGCQVDANSRNDRVTHIVWAQFFSR